MNNCDINAVTEFYLTPFSPSRIHAILIFTLFLFMYLLAPVSNLILIALVCGVPQLHTSIFFFLCNLSSVDVIYVSTVLPKMLFTIITEDKTISSYGCITQLSFFLCCGNAENNILVAMAYDRYVAICSPLHYSLIMTRKVFFIIAISYMTFSAVNSFVLTLMMSTLSFCFSYRINHFFCDLLPLMALSTDDTKSMKIFLSIDDIFVGFAFILIVTPYIRIISTILKMRSSRGRFKAFSSCSSHIITVLLFYGPAVFVYMKPVSKESKEEDKIFSMFYVAVVPMLNPFVYNLGNKEVLEATRKIVKIIWNRIVLFQIK